jgi:sterol desaturase/sphingolipid hydroxylase (fatty acid hydroxylase superfamily)
VVAAEPFVEWLVHTRVLHGRPVTVAGRVVDLGAGHRAHHAEPERIEQILLGGRYAVADSATIAVGVHVLAGLATGVLGGDRRAVTRTGLLAGYGALMTYEWTHLLMHTGYRPRSARFRRLRANHRLHHFRNESQWFGITSNIGDRVLGTLPSALGDVPLSPTARSLVA